MGGKMAVNILTEGINLYKQKAYPDALAFFLSLPVDCGADKMEIAYFLGLCYAKLQKYDEALLYLADFELNKLLETGFMTASVYAAIAYIAWEQSDTEKCLAYYENSLASDPENITSLNGLGYVLATEEKDLTRALSLCKKAVNNSPNSAACLDSLGFVYYKLGLYADAKKYLEQAEMLDRDNEIIAEHIRQVQQAGA